MIYIILVVLIVGLEYLIKNYMEAKIQKGEKRDILCGKITINKLYNKGAFLNLLENKKEIVKTVSCIFLGLLLLLFAVTLPKKGNRLMKLGLSLVLGGAVSNVSDRFLRGYVVDYFSINSSKCRKLKNIVFNLADIAIFLGALLVMLASVFSAVFERGADKAAK